MGEENHDERDVLHYKYEFVFVVRDEKMEFNIKLDRHTLNLISKKKNSYPDWTQLDFNKCPNCPLDSSEHEHCPIAISMSDIVEMFNNEISFEKVGVFIDIAERKYMKQTSLQDGLSSLIGIYMVTSGCPILEMLKPMVRHHLPFATLEETEYRATSMYLLAQYFREKRGLEPDWKLKNLVKMYDEIRNVNIHFTQRLKAIAKNDANINALISLDCFASTMSFTIDSDMMEELEMLFESYYR